MIRPRTEFATLRFSRLDKERLLLALAFSLLAHLAIWGGYEAGKKTGLWKKVHGPQWKLFQKPSPQPLVKKVDPTVFIEVTDPAAEAPKQAKYYSDKNSRAANPDTKHDTAQPKINGQQTYMAKTENTQRPAKTEPAPPTEPPKAVVTKTARPSLANTLNPGLGEKDKAQLMEKPPEKTTAQQRPRSLKEAREQQEHLIVGQQMHQEGGVKHHALTSTLDAMSTPFGAYDRKIIEAIQQRWYDLLDSQQFASDRTGKVTVYFHLNSDGTVTEANITSNTVGSLLSYVCQAAIEQAAPFEPWPADMRRMIGSNFREITFTFYYY